VPAGQLKGDDEPALQNVPAAHGPPVAVTLGGLETTAPSTQ